jgi:hypothetical protein
LIRIKVPGQAFGILPQHHTGGCYARLSIFVSAAVISVFVVFAGVLIWGNFQTHPDHRPAAPSSTRRSF